MKYINNLLPFLESKELGIISKLCLIYTTTILGIFAGSLAIFSSILAVFENFYLAIVLFITGIAFVAHYIFVRKGIKLKSSKDVFIAYILLGIGFCAYLGIISGMINLLIFGIPLIKLKKIFRVGVNSAAS